MPGIMAERGDVEERKVGYDDKKGKVESLSFHPVMLRLDRGIRKIGGSGRGITRSSRVMAEKEENVGDNGRERGERLGEES